MKTESTGEPRDHLRAAERIEDDRRVDFDAPDLVYDLANGTHAELAFQAALRRGFRFHAVQEWSADVDSLDELPRLVDGTVIYDSWGKDTETVVIELDAAVLYVQLERYAGSAPTVTVQAQAASRLDSRFALAVVRETLRESADGADRQISVTFWYYGQRSGRRVVRQLDAPTWDETRRNYAPRSGAALEPLMLSLPGVVDGGRLILWHGPPGTGKTTALRALARENSSTVGLEYVLDPEGFFGRDAGYFVDVLFDEEAASDGKLRLIVLEDCDELLEADATNRGGQGLARLLNMVDGLVGQGLHTAVLITTNEPVSAFHPAVLRPGRCGALVAFDLFDRAAARTWLGSPIDEEDLPERASLIDLIALREGRPITPGPTAIGFHHPSSRR